MQRLQQGESILDAYGAYDPVEFMAVAIESFFGPRRYAADIRNSTRSSQTTFGRIRTVGGRLPNSLSIVSSTGSILPRA